MLNSVKPRSTRLGYMGFLTTISLAIANAASTNPKLEDVVRAHGEWMNYVNTSLTEIRTIETKPLGGHRPLGVPGGESSEEEEEQHDTDSIFDRYKLGFTDDFPEDANEDYDEGEMTFDTTGFGGSYHSDEKNVCKATCEGASFKANTWFSLNCTMMSITRILMRPAQMTAMMTVNQSCG